MTSCVAGYKNEIWIADDTDTAVSISASSNQRDELGESDSSIRVDERRERIEHLLTEALQESVTGLVPRAASFHEVVALSLQQAESVLMSLPPDLPLPDVDVGPNGRALLEWYFGPGAVLTIEVAPYGALLYSVLTGPSSSHGTEWLTGFIPQAVRLAFSRLLEYASRARLAHV